MKIVILSASDINFDGRLRELIYTFEMIGNTYYVSANKTGEKFSERNIVHKYKNFNLLKFYKFCYSQIKKIKDIDVIVADNRKAIIPSLILKKLFKIKLSIYDSRELYVISDVKHLKGKVGCIIEKMLNNKFDIIISANKERADIMRKSYRLKETPIVFENIREIKNYNKSDKDFGSWENIFNEYKYNFISTAGCDISRLTDKFVNAIGEQKNCSLFLIGSEENQDKEKIEKIIDDNNFKNIFIIGKLKPEELAFFLEKSQIGIVSYHQEDLNNKYCASGKIYEYLFSDLVILSTTNPPLKNFCDEYQVGVSDDNIREGIINLIDNYDFYKKNVQSSKVSLSVENNRKILKEEILERFIKKHIGGV